PLRGTATTPSMSIWRIITDGDRLSETRAAADAPRRPSAGGRAARAEPAQGRDRAAAGRLAADALRHPGREAAGDARHGAAARQALRQRADAVAQPAEALRSLARRAGAGAGNRRDPDDPRRLTPPPSAAG